MTELWTNAILTEFMSAQQDRESGVYTVSKISNSNTETFIEQASNNNADNGSESSSDPQTWEYEAPCRWHVDEDGRLWWGPY